MPTLFAANESVVLINGQPIEGVQAIEYRNVQQRENVYAVGIAERIGQIAGHFWVEGRLKVNSTAPAVNAITGDTAFQITAQLRHGNTSMTLSFDDCYLTEKTFEMGVGSVGSSVYTFSATRIREEIAST
ncbi:MAG: hypothetical protein A4E66_00567 [Syntrophus sp. PtaB.Bin001]|nr:MAG: hypothetical protein A4E66_00567 [Syntrophus sp. PtaB.Bin001]